MSHDQNSSFKRITSLIYGLLLIVLVAFPAHIRDRLDDFPQNIVTRNGSEFADHLANMMEPLGIERSFDVLRLKITELLFGL